jgi:hypothetical protein
VSFVCNIYPNVMFSRGEDSRYVDLMDAIMVCSQSRKPQLSKVGEWRNRLCPDWVPFILRAENQC